MRWEKRTLQAAAQWQAQWQPGPGRVRACVSDAGVRAHMGRHWEAKEALTSGAVCGTRVKAEGRAGGGPATCSPASAAFSPRLQNARHESKLSGAPPWHTAKRDIHTVHCSRNRAACLQTAEIPRTADPRTTPNIGVLTPAQLKICIDILSDDHAFPPQSPFTQAGITLIL